MNKTFIRTIGFVCLLLTVKVYAIEMIKIPEITFTRADKNNNKQEVTVSSFYMSKYDVTIEEWFEYLEESLTMKSQWKSIYTKEEFIISLKYFLSEMGFIDIDTITINTEWPVFNITCNRALNYCNYLSEKEGLELCYEWIDDGSENGKVILNPKANGYRLPTLAEWQAVSCIYTDEITEEYLKETNNLNTKYNFSKNKKPNIYGLIDIISDRGKFLWDYYDEDELYLEPKVKNPLGSNKYTPDWNAIHFNEPIYETRYITRYYSDDKRLSNVEDFLKRPVYWIPVNESVACTIRLVRNITPVKIVVGREMTVSDNLRLRKSISTDSEIITTMQKGTKVNILKIQKEDTIDNINSFWVEIEVLPNGIDKNGKEIPEGTKGWCFGGYLE